MSILSHITRMKDLLILCHILVNFPSSSPFTLLESLALVNLIDTVELSRTACLTSISTCRQTYRCPRATNYLYYLSESLITLTVNYFNRYSMLNFNYKVIFLCHCAVILNLHASDFFFFIFFCERH